VSDCRGELAKNVQRYICVLVVWELSACRVLDVALRTFAGLHQCIRLDVRVSNGDTALWWCRKPNQSNVPGAPADSTGFSARSRWEPKSDSVSIQLGASQVRSWPRPPTEPAAVLGRPALKDASSGGSPDDGIDSALFSAAPRRKARQAVANIHSLSTQNEGPELVEGAPKAM
jgi:hypothetical protein